jgi:hypothetical protein
MWHYQVVYPSSVLEFLELCVDGDEAHVGKGLLVIATKWNLVHPIMGD